MRYRKKPVVIEAIQYNGTTDSRSEILAFMGLEHIAFSDTQGVFIPTLEGVMTASIGDWIIKGVKGEFYPCKPDIFAATYEPEDIPANAAGQKSLAGTAEPKTH